MTHRPLSTLLLITALLGTACAVQPTTDSWTRETDDLGVATRDAIALADQFGPARVLLVFDIDNTLLAMEQGLGSDQWYDWQKGLADADPCDQRLAGERLAVQGALYFASAMRPTQPDAAAHVRQAQDAGMAVIALTSRGVDFRLATFRELRRNGFSFAFSTFGPAGGLAGDYVPAGGTRPARFEDGVALSSGQHKGMVLADLLTRTDTPLPAVLVMVDDKPYNVDAVRETFAELGVPVHAWRYSGEDPTVAEFDPDAAAALWSELAPALQTLEALLGPDHYSLPPADPACTAHGAAGGPG